MKVRRGGGATAWPWWQLEFRIFKRCFTFSVSRQYPKVRNGDTKA